MTEDEMIDKLWEQSNHGTRREDVVAAFNAGAVAAREAYITKAEAKELANAYRGLDELVDAAKAVVDRWDSPLWKDLPHTGNFIGALRAALAKVGGK